MIFIDLTIELYLHITKIVVSNFVIIEQEGNQMIYILVYFEIFILHRF